MVSFVMIMLTKFMDGLPQGPLAEQNRPFQARFLDGSYESFGVGIQIRRARRQLNGLHPGTLQDLQEFRPEQGVPVMDQVSLAHQEAFRSIAEIASNLAHPKAIRFRGHSGDRDPPTREVD